MWDHRVGVVGAGPVGLVTAAVLASWGTPIALVEKDQYRLKELQNGRTPFFEPGLAELVEEQLANKSLVVSPTLDVLERAMVTFICVGTPPAPDGTPDLNDLDETSAAAAKVLPDRAVLVIKSTVPPGTTNRIEASIARHRSDISVVACPEFLREGQALEDMRSPTRIIVGGIDRRSCQKVADLFSPSKAPVILTSPTEAELIKYGSNAFLAIKISFINELASLCDVFRADVIEVAKGIGADPRIGPASLKAGLGFGGSCFPKDIRGLEEAATAHGYTSWLLKACIDINVQRRYRFVADIRSALGGQLDGKRIAVLGLAFKPGTDDLRQAPAVDVIRSLVREGVEIMATDPKAIAAAKMVLSNVQFVPDPYECARDADALVLATEWPEYGILNWKVIRDVMRGNLVFDGRNFLNRELLASLGFRCHGIGRPVVNPMQTEPEGSFVD